MSKKPVGTIFVDNRLASYDILMKDPAGTTLLDAGRGLLIEDVVADLTASWRMTDYARNLPHLFVTGINTAAAKAAGTTSDSVPAKIIAGLVSHLEGRLDRSSLRKVEVAVGKMHRKLRLAKKQIVDQERRERELLAEHAWKGWLELHPFVFALAASEAQAYSAFYFAYESFLSGVIDVRTGEWPETTGGLADAIRAELGPALFDRCWAARPIEAARHVRDALAHRGGRVQKARLLTKAGRVKRWATSDFADLLHVEDGRIRVSAAHTKDLYALLYERVLEVIEAQRVSEQNGVSASSVA